MTINLKDIEILFNVRNLMDIYNIKVKIKNDIISFVIFNINKHRIIYRFYRIYLETYIIHCKKLKGIIVKNEYAYKYFYY